jgi:hypothetical protein
MEKTVTGYNTHVIRTPEGKENGAKTKTELHRVAHAYHPNTERLREEDHEFQARLGNTARPVP